MQSTVAVSPFRCKVWRHHDRLEDEITEQTCEAEIRSFLEHGQLVPALGRRLRNDPDHDVELVYGARRLFVARHINKPLLVEVRELSDRDAIIAMDIENRQRKDISPYERGRSYARWLHGGFFSSQEDMARALRVSESQVSRLLKVARLPTVVVSAFPSALEICENWGLDLAAALEDPQRRPVTIETARAIAARQDQIPAREVYRRLITGGARRRTRAMSHDKIVKDDSGAPLFRIRHQRNSIAVILPMATTSRQRLEEIERAIVDILQRPHAPALREVRLGH